MSASQWAGDPAAIVLFGKGRRALLTLLYSRPERTFYLREIARLTLASAGTTQRELRALEGAGLVTASRRGNQRHYKANADSPLFASLRTLIERTMGAPELIRAALAPVADRLFYAGIFGSFARGTLRPASDVDVLVIGDVEFAEVADAVAGAEERLGRAVNPKVYPLATFTRRLRERQSFLLSVLAGPLIPVCGVLPDVTRPLARERMAGGHSSGARGGRQTP